MQNLPADRLVMKRSEEIRDYRCTKITSDIDDFLLKKVDEFIGEINLQKSW